MLQGGLFARYFLLDGIRETEAWKALDDAAVSAARTAIRSVYDAFPIDQSPNETKTEDDLIWKILAVLDWAHWDRQVNLSQKGKELVPDGLLYPDQDAKARADTRSDEWRKYTDGLAIVESKRWRRELDRAGGAQGDFGVPATQMIRYLDCVAAVTEGHGPRWGILTNGAHWRLSYQAARSRAEHFLDLDLPAILGLPGTQPSLLDEDPDHLFRDFLLMFRRAAFVPARDGRSFHHLSLDEGRSWEARVTEGLSDVVFDTLFPTLVDAVAGHDPDRPTTPDAPYLEEVRDAALILLYRLLFVLYAEDRNLLPARDRKYDDYGMRQPVREHIARRLDENDTLSDRADAYYRHMRQLFALIDEGDSAIGLPPYNGGLFAPGRPGARILDRVTLPDAVFAPLVDALSRHQGPEGKRWINYRDLSVQHLGSIYERLLENDVRWQQGRAVVSTAGEARHESGSFYTPEGPVGLILDRAVGPLLDARRAAFRDRAEALASDTRPRAKRLEDLRALDPATRMLDIKVCDPAMGSGHFLVSLVDYLGDRVLAAIEDARDEVTWADYASPLAETVAAIRAEILANARAGNWTITDQQLEDRHIVRRMILKRVIYGVDLNPMAVELAKLSLWLHTFTVGAPLSFLEHHLRCGDSICGEWVGTALDELDRIGARMFVGASVARAQQTAQGMAEIERLADADLSEVHRSRDCFEAVVEATTPLNRFLDLMQARRWIGDDLPAAHEACAWSLEQRNITLSPATFVETAFRELLTNQYGDPVAIAEGTQEITAPPKRKAPPQDTRSPKRRRGKATDYPADEARRVARELVARGREVAAAHRFLHWPVAFPGVWGDWSRLDPDGGFDAVIGNPPYVRQEKLGPAKPFLQQAYRAFDGYADLYVYFYELGLRLLKPGGRLSFITTNKWMRAGYGENLLRLIQDTAWVDGIVDFGHARQIFPDADVFPCVLTLRRPTDDQPAPDMARVAVIQRDDLDMDRMTAQVDAAEFDMPRAALTAEGWLLEPAEVHALMRKIAGTGVTLKEYVGSSPLYGLKTGFNDAFVIDHATKDRLEATGGPLPDIIRPYVRGQDLERWAPARSDLWMIVLRSSANHPWPWADAGDEAEAERLFQATHPALHGHMKPFEARLRKRQDKGRFWWELRACSYYDAFESPKLWYTDITWTPGFSLDTSNTHSNNTIYFVPSDSKWLVAALNSPVMWWFAWRELQHGKDDALRYFTADVESFPIAVPTDAGRRAVEDRVTRLVAIKREVSQAGAAVVDWLRVEHGIDRPSLKLREPAHLDADAFVAEVRKGRKGALSAAALKAIRDEYAASVAPARALLAEAGTLERQVSDLVNEAYGLTPAEVDLMWRTAPPRMPFTPQ